MDRKWIIFILMIALTVIGCQNTGSEGDEEQNAIPVAVKEVARGTVRQTITFNGEVKAELEVKVFSKIPDRIERFYVDEGDRVAKDDPIARIVATAIEQTARQAEAQKNNIETEYARAQRLSQEDAMSQQQFDAIQTQVTQARAAYTSAQSRLDDATILSPISGIIGKRYYEAGDMASPAFPVVSVVQMNRVKIVFDATEEDLGKLAVGQSAEVRVRSYPDEVFRGHVSKISPILDPLTRMATIEVLVLNSDFRLKPGMFAEAEILTGVIENTLVVPRFSVIESTSLESDNGKDQVVKNYFVYMVNDSNRAEQRQLKVIYVNHTQLAVGSGIQVGEKLVISGQNNLRDGLPVLVSDEKEAE